MSIIKLLKLPFGSICFYQISLDNLFCISSVLPIILSKIIICINFHHLQ